MLALALSASSVHARREATFNYPYSRVWTTAIRLMRVDCDSAITEKDKEDGYFLFEYPDRGKTYSGSMELIAVEQDGVESVRVVLTIQTLPSYVENMLMDKLSRKLTQEFGPPPERVDRRPDKRPPSDSGGASDDAPTPGNAERPKAPASSDTERSDAKDEDGR